MELARRHERTILKNIVFLQVLTVMNVGCTRGARTARFMVQMIAMNGGKRKMTDLERRALLGDREAQEECTKAGYAIACPICGFKSLVKGLSGRYSVCCVNNCVGTRLFADRQRAVESWNTRTAPPIGRCETCRWGLPDENPNGPDIFCDQFDKWLLKDDFCSCYEPKEA